MTPATLSAFTYELEKIAISGEFAANALAKRVTAIKDVSNIHAAARMAQRTQAQGAGIGAGFLHRAEQAHAGLMRTRGGAGAIAKAGDKLDLANAHHDAFAMARDRAAPVVAAHMRAPEMLRQNAATYVSPLLRR